MIDEVIKRTGGVPYSIGFTEERKERVVNADTISFLNFEMTTGFCESTKKFCYDNKLAIKASNPNVQIVVPEDLKMHLRISEPSWVSFDLGVKSVNDSFEFHFALSPDYHPEGEVIFKITVLHQYRRSKKISFVVREEIVKLRPGKKEEAVKS